jgi:uncharacterized membrane-anchored protein YhcB (DUF1043 family)
MRNFLAGLSVGLIIGCIVMYLYNDTGIKETNIDERVQREIDSSGFLDLDAIGRGRYLDSLASLRTK